MNGKKKQTTQSGSDNPAEKSNVSKKMTFRIDAAHGSSVFLAGSFNNWDPKGIALTPNADGMYSADVALSPGRHEYKFLVNGLWRLDKQSRQQVPNSYGTFNSVIEVA